MRSLFSIVCALLIVTLPATALEPVLPIRLAIVVSPDVSVRNFSPGDLRRVFLGQISRWPNGHRITIFVPPPSSPEGHLFLDRVVRMSDIDYSQWWIGAVFRGDASATPRVIDGSHAMVRSVVMTPDAIGLVAFPSVTPDVTVVTIAGKAPGDPHYSLTR